MRFAFSCRIEMKITDYKPISPRKWCERNTSLDYGAFDMANHPLMREPLETLATTRGKYVGLIGSVQHIKTLTAQLWQLYGLATDPARAAMYDLTESALKEFSDDKFTPLIDSTEAITRLIPNQLYRKTKFYTSTNYGAIRLLSANVLASRNSKTLERVSADESWAYGENWLDQIKDRTSSFAWSWQMFLPSSGQTKGGELDAMWQRSTQKRWHVKCDCCGDLIPYIWRAPAVGDAIPVGGMRWAAKADYMDGDAIDWDALKDSVFYECQLCGGRNEPGIAAQKRRNESGKYIATNPKGSAEFEFFNYNAMAHIPWPSLVEQFKLANIARKRGNLEPLENFIRKRLAEPWSEADYMSADISHSAAGGYQLGELMDAQKSLMFVGVDVQKDHYYFAIRQFAMIDGKLRSRLIDRGKVSTEYEIEEACNRFDIPQNPWGYPGCRVFIDGNYNTAQVQRLAAEMGWIVLRGEPAKDFKAPDGSRQIYNQPQRIDADEGTGNAGRRFCKQIQFSKQSAKNKLSLLRGLKDNKGLPLWTHSDDAGAQYDAQINAWAKIVKTRPDGSTYHDWINTNRDDHYYDCEVMVALAESMVDWSEVGRESE